MLYQPFMQGHLQVRRDALRETREKIRGVLLTKGSEMSDVITEEIIHGTGELHNEAIICTKDAHVLLQGGRRDLHFSVECVWRKERNCDESDGDASHISRS